MNTYTLTKINNQLSIVLDDGELATIQRPIRGHGGFQSLLRSMRVGLHGNVLTLTPAMARRLVKYATRYGKGGFEMRLQRIIDAACRLLELE